MSNTHRINVTVPFDVWQNAKDKGINISGFLTAQLREQLALMDKNNSESMEERCMTRIHELNDRLGFVPAQTLTDIAGMHGLTYIELKARCDEEGIQVGKKSSENYRRMM